MQKQLKYMNIEYTEKDNKYINDMIIYLEQTSEEIVNFFEIENFGNKVQVKLWDDISKFRVRNYEVYPSIADKVENVPEWCCGFAYNNNNMCYVETLCLEEYKKTLGHDNATLKDLIHLILHEFTHAVHLKIDDKDCACWLSEGLATTISHQYDGADLFFDATLEQIKNDDLVGYGNYYTMFYYVYNTYGRDYVLELVNNYELQKQVTEKLYKETVEYMKNIKKL